MSIIRYKYKADKDFKSVQFEGTSCSLGELKRLIAEKSSRSGTHHPKDDYDLIISNATTYEEYKDNSHLIPRNASIVVARRIRGALESLTPTSNQKLVVSSDDIINEYLRPAILESTSLTIPPTANTSSVVESKAIPLEMLSQSSTNTQIEELSEDERNTQVANTSRSHYLPSHRSNTCHHCKQAGHFRNQCPVLLQSSSANSNDNSSGSPSSSSGGDYVSKFDATHSRSSGPTSQSALHTSHIITNQSSDRMSYHYNNRYQVNGHYHRGPSHFHHEPVLRKTAGIPRDGLIQVPRPIVGALIDQTGASVVPRQMAQFIIETSEKKGDTLAQRNRQFQEKGVLPPAPPPSMLPLKSADEEVPPDDLLCPICKKVYTDAVIAPCCHISFCDACLRTALVESEEHECLHCHRQQVAIDQINPNLFLRKYVNRWYEEQQQKSSHSYLSLPQQTSTVNYGTSRMLEQDLDFTPTRTSPSTNMQNLNDIDEYDVAILSTTSQGSVAPMRTAPIVIRMQPTEKSLSPSHAMLFTKPADMTFEGGKASDINQTMFSQQDTNADGKVWNKLADRNISDTEKSDRQTPPSQVAPVSTILSSPPTTTTTTMARTPSVVSHYYPAPPHLPPYQQHVSHGIMYPQQTPSTSTTGLYPLQPNYYSPPVHVSYFGGHDLVGVSPMLHMNVPSVSGDGMHHYSARPPYPMTHPHLQPNQLNGFHLAHFEVGNVSTMHHPNTAFVPTSTSTLVPSYHHQTDTQSLSTSTLSKDEFYIKQRHLQRTHRSTSRRYSHSRSSSYTTSDSRSSSFSRRNDRRPQQRSSRSRSRQRTAVRRHNDIHTISSNYREKFRSTRSNSKQRRSSARHRSPSYRNRTRAPSTRNNHSSNYRRPSPRPYRSTRDGERRHSPRPPPTIQQSMQRTIVYKRESSSSKAHPNRDRHQRKSPSRHRSRLIDDRTASSSKTEQQTQPELILSSSPMTVPSDKQGTILLSTIMNVSQKNHSDPLQSIEVNSTDQVKKVTDDKTSNSGKKRKKHHHHHHKKNHRHRSKSEKRHLSKDNDSKTMVEDATMNSTPIVEAQ